MREPGGFTLVSHTLGGLPLVNHVLRRLRFEEFLARHLPPPDARAELPPSAALGVLTRNLVPVTLGNMIGGSVLVAAVYWFAYLRARPVA